MPSRTDETCANAAGAPRGPIARLTLRGADLAALASLFWQKLGQAATGLVDVLLAWQERARQRHHLNGLDERALKDMGLTRTHVDVESRKPFWRH
jgi:uncharacterized protein YjiS (DUF1127 family)